MARTSIQLQMETKKKLDDLKIIEKEPYDSVINRLLQRKEVPA